MVHHHFYIKKARNYQYNNPAKNIYFLFKKVEKFQLFIKYNMNHFIFFSEFS